MTHVFFIIKIKILSLAFWAYTHRNFGTYSDPKCPFIIYSIFQGPYFRYENIITAFTVQ